MEEEKLQFQILKQNIIDKNYLVQRKGEFTNENKQSYYVPDIEILLKWNLLENKGILLDQYFEVPDPQDITPWTEVQEQELVRLKDNSIEMKDNAVAVSTKKMANVVCNIMNPLSINEETRLIESLNQEEGICIYKWCEKKNSSSQRYMEVWGSGIVAYPRYGLILRFIYRWLC